MILEMFVIVFIAFMKEQLFRRHFSTIPTEVTWSEIFYHYFQLTRILWLLNQFKIQWLNQGKPFVQLLASKTPCKFIRWPEDFKRPPRYMSTRKSKDIFCILVTYYRKGSDFYILTILVQLPWLNHKETRVQRWELSRSHSCTVRGIMNPMFCLTTVR